MFFQRYWRYVELIYPKSFEDRKLPSLAGISLSPSFEGKPLERSKPMFSEHENNAFMIDGKWKLVGKGVSSPKDPEIEKWELYNLKEDRTELNNLALIKKDRLKIMAKSWHDWALQDKVYPSLCIRRNSVLDNQ